MAYGQSHFQHKTIHNYSRFPIPDSRFPTPDSLLPIPDSRFPIPDSFIKL
ncbi:MAG: hypothetical protein F6K65_38745 [Moorea sp. SIO3C2]|nr:hypothetical protein [Moorena sp. SIO3C2]